MQTTPFTQLAFDFPLPDSPPLEMQRLLRLADDVEAKHCFIAEVVFLAAHARAARRFNSGECSGLSDDDAYDRLHDEADREAESANAGDLVRQLEYLRRRGYDDAAVAGLLTEATEHFDDWCFCP